MSSGLVGGRTGGVALRMSWMALAVRVGTLGGLVFAEEAAAESADGAVRFKGDVDAALMDDDAAMSLGQKSALTSFLLVCWVESYRGTGATLRCQVRVCDIH